MIQAIRIKIKINCRLQLLSLVCSVADPNPDPDPPDPGVFGPPGSGSGSTNQRYGSGSFYHHAKIVRKTLIPNIFVTLFEFLSLKNDVNVALKSHKQKKLCSKIRFLLAS
jgi:hypothetical protein